MIRCAFFGGLDADVYKANPASLPGLPEHEVNPDKHGVALWAPIVIESGARRAKENVQEVTAFVVDLDGCNEHQLAATFAALEGLEYWAHTSHGHNPAAGVIKWRFVLPFDKPAPGNRHPEIWRAAALKYCPWLDQQCKDSSRAYFLPSCPPDREADAIHLHAPGTRLDWQALPLAAPAAAPARPLAAPARVLPPEDAAALVAVLGGQWPPLGTRHKMALALGAALRRDGLGDEQIAAIVEAIYTQNKDPQPAARAKTALDSAAGVASGAAAYGWSTVAEVLGGEFAAAARVFASLPTVNVDLTRLCPPPAPAAPAAPADFTAWPDELSDSWAPLHCNQRGIPINCSANVERILSGHPAWAGVLSYDALGNRVLARRAPPVREGAYSPTGTWTDDHTTTTQHWILDRFGFEPVKSHVDDAVTAAANRHRFHPIQEYLTAQKWDGVLRLDRLLPGYFGAVDSVYSRAVGRKFLISAVARAMDPGCKVDTMLIIEGAQGKRKSTAFSVLAGDAWFTDSAIDFRSKDAVQSLQGKWIVEIAELDSFRRAQMTTIKAFISSRVDNIRPSYGRRNADFPRQCVFVGTTNESHYLTDTTGNRRFWPVECGDVDVDGLIRDRDQLWAEAVVAWASDEDHWLTQEQTIYAQEEQASREVLDPWEEEIIGWLSTAPAQFQAHQIMNHLGIDKAQRTAGAAGRIGAILKRLGYVQQKQRLPGNWRRTVRIYSYDANLAKQSNRLHDIPGGKVSGVPSKVGAAKASGGQ